MPTWYQRPAARSWTCSAAPPPVAAFHAGLPGYAPTPLVELPVLAAELGLARVFVKDESSRLGLPAFKILGASWAVCRLLAARAGVPVETVDLARLRGLARSLPATRLVSATDGNHGRAVARMAALLGLAATVYVPAVVPAGSVAAIAAEGASVVPVDGSYDEAVRHAAAAAAADAVAELVQDTAWPGYDEVPRWIVEGYATLFREVDAQLHAAGAPAASLVAVPIGVGSLAQAAVTHHRAAGGAPDGATGGAADDAADDATDDAADDAAGGVADETAGGGAGGGVAAVLGVEPTTAACVLASLVAGDLVTVPTGSTVMAGLNCGTPSSLAWPYLRGGMDAAVAVTDEDALRAVDDLARLGVLAGPSGAASLAGVRAALTGPGSDERRAALGLTPDSVAVLLSTEGPVGSTPPAG